MRTTAVENLAANAESIRRLVEGLENEPARWKPSASEWSILEVINHLYDEEREDFRVRLEMILHRPSADWPPIDPQGWVSKRRYNERDLSVSLEMFLTERQASLEWLAELTAPNWHASAEAPWGQPIRAGDMLAAWVAHDLLHLRQLVALRWGLTTQALAPFDPRYAGEW